MNACGRDKNCPNPIAGSIVDALKNHPEYIGHVSFESNIDTEFSTALLLTLSPVEEFWPGRFDVQYETVVCLPLPAKLKLTARISGSLSGKSSMEMGAHNNFAYCGG
jgi:hypothetical protein